MGMIAERGRAAFAIAKAYARRFEIFCPLNERGSCRREDPIPAPNGSFLWWEIPDAVRCPDCYYVFPVSPQIVESPTGHGNMENPAITPEGAEKASATSMPTEIAYKYRIVLHGRDGRSINLYDRDNLELAKQDLDYLADTCDSPAKIASFSLDRMPIAWETVETRTIPKP